MTYETVTFNVNITLSTERGEVPANAVVEEMIQDRLSEVFDDHTGLECIAVDVFGRDSEIG